MATAAAASASVPLCAGEPEPEPEPQFHLRILTCQTNGALRPSVGENLAFWRATLLETTGLGRADRVDVLHFPETAFSRYVYANRADLAGCGAAEEAGKGAVFEFCHDMALHFDAYVITGYIEQSGAGAGCEHLYHNSLYVVGRNGGLVSNHRKRDLFTPDCTWTQPAPGPYSTLVMYNSSGQAFTAGLILCQEIAGPLEDKRSLSREKCVGRQFAAEQVNVIFFSANWTFTNAKRKLRDGWDTQLVSMHGGSTSGGAREFLFCVASGCGEEENCLTEEQWGPFVDTFGPGVVKSLRKQGFSGVKKFSGGEPIVVEGVGVDAPGAAACSGGVLDLEPEGWRLYTATIRM